MKFKKKSQELELLENEELFENEETVEIEVKDKKKSHKGFWIFTGIVSIVLMIATAIALPFVWNFMDAYNETRPATAMDAYMEAIDDAYLKTLLQTENISVTEFEDQDVILNEVIYPLVLGKSYAYEENVGISTKENPSFTVLAQNEPFAVITLENSEDSWYGFNFWQAKAISLVDDFYKSKLHDIEVRVPTGFALAMGEHEVHEGYVTELIPYEGLSEIDKAADNAPTTSVYTIRNLYSTDYHLVLTDENGEEVPLTQEENVYSYALPTEGELTFSVLVPKGATLYANGVEILRDKIGVDSYNPELLAGLTEYIGAKPSYEVYLLKDLLIEPKCSAILEGTELEAIKILSDRFEIVTANTNAMADRIKPQIKEFVPVFVEFITNGGANRNEVKKFVLPSGEYANELVSLAETYTKMPFAKEDCENYEITNFASYTDNCLSAQLIFKDPNNEDEVILKFTLVYVLANGDWYLAKLIG